MNQLQIIGISGKIGTGKDYIGSQYLRPYGFHQISLAWHFKVSTVAKNLGTFEEVFFTKPEHVRRELQLEGTERGREVYGEDIWCRAVEAWINLYREHWGIHKFYIPDVRFPNEVAFVQRLGGVVWRIDAPYRDRVSGATPEARVHLSEISLDNWVRGTASDKFDGWIDNDPNPTTPLYEQISKLLMNTGWD